MCGLLTLTTLSAVDGTRRLITYKEWSDLIQAAFEPNYYVPLGNIIPLLWKGLNSSVRQTPPTTLSTT